MEFKVLGPLEARHGETEIALGTGRQRVLLVLLLLHANEVLSTERLVDALWGERPPDTAVKVIQGYVSGLRRAFSEAGADGAAILETRPPGYVLNVEPEAIDNRRFEELSGSGRALVADDPARASELLSDALALWRGEALADARYEEFAQPEIARLEELRIATIEDRIEADLALGRQRAVVAELEELVRAHPLRERLRAQLMLALYRAGRQGDALETYRRGREVLVEELGLEPSRELKELERAILEQDPKLDAPTDAPLPPATAAPVVRGRGRAVAAAAAIAVAAVAGVVAFALAEDQSRPAVAPDSLVRVDPDKNEVVDVVRVGREPIAVTALGDDVWVGNSGDDSLTHVAPGGRTRTVGGFPFPRDLSTEGARMWIGSNATGTLVALDGATGRVLRRIRLPAAGASSVAYGAGALWIVEEEVAIFRVDPRTGRVTHRWTDRSARKVAFGHGAAWIVRGGPGELLRIDARSLAFRRVEAGSTPDGVGVGFGAVWVASTGDDTARRFSPFTVELEDLIDVGDRPAGIAFGAGSVWVANHDGGTVTRIDPTTNAVVATIRTGFFPTDVHVGAGAVWVAVSGTRLF